MTERQALGPWLRRSLEEHLVNERNLARNTRRSYRDAFVLLLPFVAGQAGRSVDRLAVRDVSSERVRRFLQSIEDDRGCSPQTRNQRLAAIRAFARFVSGRSPEHVEWCTQIRSIPVKKTAAQPVCYLEKHELEALLAATDIETAHGRCEAAVLAFMYNTGARVSEVAQLTVGDSQLDPRRRNYSLVALLGKGGKPRQCPLWDATASALAELVDGRAATAPVFVNRQGQAFTRSGLRKLVQCCAARAAALEPSFATKRVSPHVIRHTSATHLLRSGVDINTIRVWLGHAKLDTTAIYAEVDFETKARAIAKCSPTGSKPQKPWNVDKGTMAFLRTLQ